MDEYYFWSWNKKGNTTSRAKAPQQRKCVFSHCPTINVLTLKWLANPTIPPLTLFIWEYSNDLKVHTLPAHNHILSSLSFFLLLSSTLHILALSWPKPTDLLIRICTIVTHVITPSINNSLVLKAKVRKSTLQQQFIFPSSISFIKALPLNQPLPLVQPLFNFVPPRQPFLRLYLANTLLLRNLHTMVLKTSTWKDLPRSR